ncbi:hypothetical protein QR680_015129 [Steinernema hermaphroditum]|uniref:TM2 domain-containing protein n=1 Tax=Steinernema hermaphroditum TaxID=289476 RepID=A0AA39IB89_9BILA|nr:hypothetical protein QR680_015129 [Steinernema hermaphroditum]
MPFPDLRRVLVAVAMLVLVLAFELNNVGDDSDAVIFAPSSSQWSHKPCSELYYGQYFCLEPVIDLETQQPFSCQMDNSITVRCVVAPGVVCSGMDPESGEFEKRVEDGCIYSSGASHATALMLSIFLGWLGIDRFYLGYYAIGLFKMLTFGSLFILYIVDVILIALQVLGPADGTGYRMPYYGPRSYGVRFSNETSIAMYSCFDCA